MTFIVRLVHDIEAVLIAELVELGCIGIMAGAYGVHVMGLHQRQIPVHLLRADDESGHGIAVVAVHAVKLDVLAVEI